MLSCSGDSPDNEEARLPRLDEGRFSGWQHDQLLDEQGHRLQVVDMPAEWTLDDARVGGPSATAPQWWVFPDSGQPIATILLTVSYWPDLFDNRSWHDMYDVSLDPDESASAWVEDTLHDASVVVRERSSGGPPERIELRMRLGNWLIHVEGSGAAAERDIVLAFAERVRLTAL
jgi:hypothetical protein